MAIEIQKAHKMLRFCLFAFLALAIPSLPVQASDKDMPSKAPKRSVEKFLNGTDADRNAMLKDLMKIITSQGYRDLAVVPWFVMMAKNARGREVLLIVDPVSTQVIEFENVDDETAAIEKVIPKSRN